MIALFLNDRTLYNLSVFADRATSPFDVAKTSWKDSWVQYLLARDTPVVLAASKPP